MPTFFILDYAAAFARHGQVVDLGHFEGGSFLGEATVVKVLEDKRPSRAFNNDGRAITRQCGCRTGNGTKGESCL